MSIPRHVVEEVRARLDIVEVIGKTVTLRRAGRDYVGLCPFHSDKKPSFYVVPTKGIYHCFPCGEGGDVIKFVQKTRGLTFVEAVKELAGQVGVTIEEREISDDERRRMAFKADLYGVAEAASKFFEQTLLVAPEGAPGRAYLQKRGVTLDTARKYRLGFAPDGWDRLANWLQKQRLPVTLAEKLSLVRRNDRGGLYDFFRNRFMFPILDDRGRVVAFGGRQMPGDDKGPKYMNSPESDIYDKSKTLYGLSWARGAAQRKDRILVVEGYFDALSLWQAGFEEAVAPCGTALTPAQVESIRRLARTAFAVFDMDTAGMKAAVRSLDLFLPAGITAKCIDLGDAKDPDEFVQRHGSDAFEGVLGKAQPLTERVILRTIEQEGTGPEGKARALKALVPMLRRFDGATREVTIARAAGWLGVREEAVIAAVGATAPEAAAPAAAPARWVPTKEVTHLLWLAVHFPTHVAPALADADPDHVTDRRDVQEALGRLASGASVAEVVADCVDPELARALTTIAARQDLYQEESAESATRQILARLELARVEAEIAAMNARIAGCETSGDKSSYASLARDISLLFARRTQLQKLVARRQARS
ncbi:MAG: DNA primase [Myxococcota bacterium]